MLEVQDNQLDELGCSTEASAQDDPAVGAPANAFAQDDPAVGAPASAFAQDDPAQDDPAVGAPASAFAQDDPTQVDPAVGAPANAFAQDDPAVGAPANAFAQEEPAQDDPAQDDPDQDLLPCIELSQKQLRPLCRYKLSAGDLCDDPERVQFFTEGSYRITLDDVARALRRHIKRGESPEAFRKNWFMPVMFDLDDQLAVWDIIEHKVPCIPAAVPGLIDEARVLYNVFHELDDYFAWGYDEDAYDAEDAEEDPSPRLLEFVERFLANVDAPPLECDYSDGEMRNFLNMWHNSNVAAEDDPLITALYVRFVNELAAKDDPKALEEKGYACYGRGHIGFEGDWQTARDCMLRLMEVAPKSGYANTLGYIYYYGYASGGEPDYDEAFRWFSIAAAGGKYEARYKISDMFRHGYGVPKVPEIAAHIVWDLWNENAPYIARGEFATKVADIALRMGDLYRFGINCPKDEDRAFEYYLIARFAIKMRLQRGDWYGDRSVQRNIENAIADVLPETLYVHLDEPDVLVNLRWLLRFALMNGRSVEMAPSKDAATDVGPWFSGVPFTLRIHKREDEEANPKMLVVVPKSHFCGMREEVTIWLSAEDAARLLVGAAGEDAAEEAAGEAGAGAVGLSVQDVAEEAARLLADAPLIFDEIGEPEYGITLLKRQGSKVASLGRLVTVDAGSFRSNKRFRIAAVTFETNDWRYDYLCEDESIGEGDKVMVEDKYGPCEGRVVRVALKDETEMQFPVEKYKHVICKAEEYTP